MLGSGAQNRELHLTGSEGCRFKTLVVNLGGNQSFPLRMRTRLKARCWEMPTRGSGLGGVPFAAAQGAQSRRLPSPRPSPRPALFPVSFSYASGRQHPDLCVLQTRVEECGLVFIACF